MPEKQHPTNVRVNSASVSTGLHRLVEKTGTLLGGLGALLVAGILIAVVATWGLENSPKQ